MDIFEKIIQDVSKISGSEDLIAELRAAQATFDDPSSEEAHEVALAILKKAVEGSRAAASSSSTTDDDDEEIKVTPEEKVVLEQAVETVKKVLGTKLKCGFECSKKREDIYLFTFSPKYEYSQFKVEVYVEAAPLVCFIRINFPTNIDMTYSYIVSEHIAKLNRKSSRYATYALDERDGSIEARYRMRYDGGLDETVFSAALFNSLYDADDMSPELKKLGVGKIKKDQMEEILQKIHALVKDMEE